MNEMTIEIPSLIDNVRIVESFIDNTKDQYELDDDIYGNIMIAVTESVNNAIKHGNKEDKSKVVKITMVLSEAMIKFVIEDQGKGFNFENLPDPTSPENLDKINGRGIFLMKHLCDEVRFSEKGKKVELCFYLN